MTGVARRATLSRMSEDAHAPTEDMTELQSWRREAEAWEHRTHEANEKLAALQAAAAKVVESGGASDDVAALGALLG